MDKSNINEVVKILEILENENLKNKVHFYISPVDDVASEDVNPLCFNNREFSREEILVYIKALEMGFEVIRIPNPLIGICGAVSTSSFVIDPLGDLYKCWNEIGRKECSVGNLATGLIFNKTLSEYMNYEGVSDEKCTTCAMLPTCMGGCPYAKIKTGEARCNAELYNIDQIMNLIYEYKKVES